MTREESIVENIYNLAYTKLSTEKSGHDFWHTYRVYKSATKIAKDEGADVFICQVSALVHDLIDDKLDESIRLTLDELETILGDFGLTLSEVERVVDIITKMSFKGGTNKEELSLEGKVVQDADRLDAIGAIGIARTMCYSGYKGRPMLKNYQRKGMNLWKSIWSIFTKNGKVSYRLTIGVQEIIFSFILSFCE